MVVEREQGEVADKHYIDNNRNLEVATKFSKRNITKFDLVIYNRIF